MAKKVDITTIGGLLHILGDNIDNLRADSSDANIKKSNAILQNVNAVRGIYNLAFSKQRLENLANINSDYSDYLDNKDLMGSVFGDDSDRLKREHESAQRSKMRDYERLIEKLQLEVEENKDDTPEEDYRYQEFYDDEIEIMNRVLEATPDDLNLSTRYQRVSYLLDKLTPADCGVEEEK